MAMMRGRVNTETRPPFVFAEKMLYLHPIKHHRT